MQANTQMELDPDFIVTFSISCLYSHFLLKLFWIFNQLILNFCIALHQIINYVKRAILCSSEYFMTLSYQYVEGWSDTQKRQIGLGGDKHCTCHPKNLYKQRLGQITFQSRLIWLKIQVIWLDVGLEAWTLAWPLIML